MTYPRGFRIPKWYTPSDWAELTKWQRLQQGVRQPVEFERERAEWQREHPQDPISRFVGTWIAPEMPEKGVMPRQDLTPQDVLQAMRFYGESAFWMLLPFIPSATVARLGLAGKPGLAPKVVRGALKPIEMAEKAPGVALGLRQKAITRGGMALESGARRLLPRGVTKVPEVVTAIPGGTTYLPPVEAMVSKTQISAAYNIAQSKLLLTPAGKMKPQVARLARGITGVNKVELMTEGEAHTFINALDRLTLKWGKPPKIPMSAAIITERFAAKLPLLQEIGALEKVRPARQVFEKIGLGDEVFWTALERETLYGESYMGFEKTVAELTKGIDAERRAVIFRMLDGRGEAGLASHERKLYDFAKDFYDDAAQKLKLPSWKRRKNYITHTFDAAIEEDLLAKKALDPELVRAMDMDFVVAKQIFMPYLKKRIGKEVGLKEDIAVSLLAYAKRYYRKLHYEPLIRKIRVYDRILQEQNLPNSAAYLRGYIERITGRPGRFDREMTQTLRQFAKMIEPLPGGKVLAKQLVGENAAGLAAYQYTSMLYFMWLGFKPTSAIRNLSQHALILGDVGPANFAKGFTNRRATVALKESLALRSRARAYVPGIDDSFASRWTDKTREVALKMFRAADRINVKDAFRAGYTQGERLGLPHEWCVKLGDEVAANTQYLYTRLSGASWSQTSLGRVMSPLTTWPENWLELMAKWAGARPSQVLLRYEQATGRTVAREAFSASRKSIMLYLTLVGAAYGVEKTTPLRASQYTGWTSIGYLVDIARGRLPALDIPGSMAQIVGGAATGDMRMVKSGWNRIRPDHLMGIIRQLENVAQGKTDWLSLFFYLNPESKEKAERGQVSPAKIRDLLR